MGRFDEQHLFSPPVPNDGGNQMEELDTRGFVKPRVPVDEAQKRAEGEGGQSGGDVVGRNTFYRGASLSGPQPAWGTKGVYGIGGTEVSDAEKNFHPKDPHDQVRHERAPTPEELMAMADAMEQEQLQTHNTRMGQGPAVDPIQDRQLGRANSAPDWLNQYMDAQQAVDPENVYTGPTGPAMGMSFDGMNDKVGGRKNRSEHEWLKERRNEERHAGRR